jgi:hypothetical protein
MDAAILQARGKAVFFGLAAYWARRAKEAGREAKEEKTGSLVAITEGF